jgi:dTDP-4-amino-4,6-dideoxygalactose transaminase
MRDSGIGVQVNYIPAYWHPVFERLGHKRGECPVSDEFYGREISLPMWVGVDKLGEDYLDLLRTILVDQGELK